MQAAAVTSSPAAAALPRPPSLMARRPAPGAAAAAAAAAPTAPWRRRRALSAAAERDGSSSSSSGSSSNGSSPATTTSNRPSPSSPPPPPAAARTGGPRPPPRNNNKKNGGGGGGGGGNGATTRLGELVRSTPVLNRFADGTLVLGDAVMVASTQLSSERISWDEAAPLLAVSVAAWVLASAARGDYLPDRRHEYDDPLSLSLGFPVLIGIADACVTWAVAVVPAVGADAWLAAHFFVNPLTVAAAVSPYAAAATSAAGGTFAQGAAGPPEHVLSPQLEVLVAMLITMSSWRGIAAWLRLSSY
jgi:hypothetical protein